MSSVYVYALVDRGGGRLSAGSLRLTTVRVGRVHAIVERRSAAPEISEADLRRQHATVLALAEIFDPIVPVRFGCLMERSALAGALREAEADVVRALDRVRGCRQMTVRIFGGRAVESRLPPPARSGTDYLRARRAAARSPLPPAGRAVQRAVTAFVKEERIDPGTGPLRATLHHLVPVRACARYARTVTAIARHRERLVVSGPWPPFAFGPESWR